MDRHADDKHASRDAVAAAIADTASSCGISLVASLPDGWITSLIARFDADARATVAGFPSTGSAGDFFPLWLGFSRVSDTDMPVAAHRSASQEQHQRPGSRRLRNGASFPHDARAPLADRGEHVQHGGADLQENLPAVAHDLARGLKQTPAHGLHLRTLPSTSKRIGAKAEIQIVGQHPDGEADRVGLERTA